MYGRMSFSSSTSTVDHIINQIDTVKFGGLDLRPQYQRGYVWKSDFKDKLIYSLVKAYPIGNISIRVLSTTDMNPNGAKSEVVDGQQRLTTIRNFMKGDYCINSEWSKQIILEIKNYYEQANEKDIKLEKLIKRLSNKGKIKLDYNDLPDIIQGNLKNYNLSITSIAEASDLQIREYFRFLQNQERLKAGEILNSMPPTNLEKYIMSLDDKEKLMDIIGFGDDRRDFDKIFYSIIGLLDSKIPFGTTDKTIQEYASDSEDLSSGLTNTNNMIKQLNQITKLDTSIKGTTRKRFLKYLLLLCAFKYVDFSTNTLDKLNNLAKIDNMLSVFFSAKANAENIEFNNYSNNVREEYRLIALLTKGGHSLKRVENRMKMLSYYVNNINERQKTSGVIPIELKNIAS